MNYDDFFNRHQKIYKTPIIYQIAYDEDTFVVQGEKLAGRIFITVQKPREKAKKLEVILIAQYKDKKLYRLWELTYPDWSKQSQFKQEIEPVVH